MRHENFQPDLQLQDFHILEQCIFLSLHNDKKKTTTVFTSIYSVVDHPNNSWGLFENSLFEIQGTIWKQSTGSKINRTQ